MSSAEQQTPIRKPNILQRIADRYRWMSLRNKVAIWVFVALILVATVSVRWVQPAYRTTKMWLFLRMADQAIARKDYNSASLAFRKALLSGQENTAPWKALAKFLDEVGSPEVINVWDRLAKMEPTVAQYRYNQAEAALKFARSYQAEEILAQMPEAWRNAPGGLRVEAEVATRKRQFPKAAALLERLLALKPDDRKAAFDLLCIRASSDDPATRDAAQEQLKQVAGQESEFTSAALRRLVTLAKDNGDNYEADRWAGKLINRPDATTQDQIAYVQMEATANSFTLPMSIANLRDYAAQHPADFGAIIEWLVSNKIDLAGTGRWIAGIPPQIAAQPSIEPAIFQYYLAVGDWDQVFEILKNPSSSLHVAPKVVDLASKALDQDRQGAANAEQTWMEAIYACEGDPQALRILSSLASASGWTSASGRAMSALADAVPGDPSVWWLLVQHENGVHNLAGLYKALEGLMRMNPYDITVASNWVLAAALLRPTDMDEVISIAKRTYYSTYPSDARAATAYAIALLQTKQLKEAMNVVDQMTLPDRREPQRAIYVGSVLAANGRKEEALDYFARSESLEGNSFPEEQMLRRIWKDVALGQATTEEATAQILAKRNDAAAEAGKINAELHDELQRRSDPAEVQRILSGLKAETESRQNTPPEVEQLIREVRKERGQ